MSRRLTKKSSHEQADGTTALELVDGEDPAQRIARGPMALRHLALSGKTVYAIEALEAEIHLSGDFESTLRRLTKVTLTRVMSITSDFRLSSWRDAC